MAKIPYSDYTTEIWVKITNPGSRYGPNIQPIRGKDVGDALSRANHLWADTVIEHVSPVNLEDEYHIDTKYIDDPIVRYHLRRTTRRYVVGKYALGWYITDALRRRTHSDDYESETSANEIAEQLNRENVKYGADNYDRPKGN